jgi:hypothetical protein
MTLIKNLMKSGPATASIDFLKDISVMPMQSSIGYVETYDITSSMLFCTSGSINGEYFVDITSSLSSSYLPTYKDYVLSSSYAEHLTAYWPLDEPGGAISGSSIAGLSGQTLNQINSPTFAYEFTRNGAAGYCNDDGAKVDFVRASSQALTGSTTVANITGSATYIATVVFEATALQGIIGSNFAAGPGVPGWYLYRTASNIITLVVSDGTNTTCTVNDMFQTSIGYYYHFAVTISNKAFAFYKNGIKNIYPGTTGSYAAGPSGSMLFDYISGSTALQVGRYSTAANYLDGKMSHIQVYNTELSQPEIKENFNASTYLYSSVYTVVPPTTGSIGAAWTPNEIWRQLKGWYDTSDDAYLILTGSTIGGLIDRSPCGANAIASSTTAGYLSKSGSFNSIQCISSSFYPGELTITQPDEVADFTSYAFVSEIGDDDCILFQDSTTNYDLAIVSGSVTSAKSTNVENRSLVVDGSILKNNNADYTRDFAYTSLVGKHLVYRAFRPNPMTSIPSSWSTCAFFSYNNASYYFSGQYGEFIIFKNELDEDERQKVEGYLAHKWGLTANLPASHPYKSVAPLVT